MVNHFEFLFILISLFEYQRHIHRWHLSPVILFLSTNIGLYCAALFEVDSSVGKLFTDWPTAVSVSIILPLQILRNSYTFTNHYMRQGVLIAFQ